MNQKSANLYQLLYKSYATKALTVEEFADLLVGARVKNDALGITGILLYKSGVFVQLLEGDKKNIEELYDVIKSDARHTQVECLYFKPASDRVCESWAMKIHNLDFGEPETLIGVESIIAKLQHPNDQEQVELPAEQLITLFTQTD